ncbi:nucleotidyltransferase family protein [Candidatus Thiodictyon syntrophicum]|nr:nucleotidyltransferase family protein [Candidatus Thiodictyon syntrophicum]
MDTLLHLKSLLAPLKAGRGSLAVEAATLGLVGPSDAQGLAPLWFDQLSGVEPATANAARLRHALWPLRQAAAANYLLQRRTAQRVCQCLTQAQVPFALFKGFATRERLYPDPSVRPAVDLDVLVAPAFRDAAIGALTARKLRFHGENATISHEAVLRDGHVSVDLHWGLLRPGRSRFELAPMLLDTIRLNGEFPVLSDDANLLVMLVHPAFTKHVNGRTARLIRVVDLDRMLRTTAPDWDWILSLIDAAGLRTAAWAVLHWQRTLMDTPLDPFVVSYLEPGPRKRRYLAYWLEHQLPARLGSIPGLVQGAFTLALHERPADAGRAIARLVRARWESGSRLKHLQRLSRTLD